MPVPRPKPIQTLPSFVPTMACARPLRRVLDLVDERAVAERLLGHVLGRRVVRDVPATAHAGVAALDRLPDAGRPVDEVTAPTRRACRSTVVASRHSAVEEVEGLSERPRVAAPAAGDALVAGPAGEAVRDAARHAAAVVADEVARARARSDRVDAGVEPIAADRHLPLRGAGRVAAEAHDARRVVLGAAGRRRVRRRSRSSR